MKISLLRLYNYFSGKKKRLSVEMQKLFGLME